MLIFNGIIKKLRIGSEEANVAPRRPGRLLFLSCIVAFIFILQTTLALGDQAAMAQKKLDDEYIAFTPKEFLHYAFMNDVKVVELFVEGGISLDATDSQGRGAIHIAAGNADGEILHLLLGHGDDVNRGDKNGTTPICIAVDKGHLENVKMLLPAKADIDALCGADMNTPLHYAVSEGHGSIVNVLIEAGASLESPNRISNTPIHAAVRSDNASILHLIIKAGADVTAKNRSGDTPLHIAVTRQSQDMVNTLLAAGAPLEARNMRGATPLWLAANYDAVEIVKILIQAGADPEAKAADGETPIQIAEKARSARVIEILHNALEK